MSEKFCLQWNKFQENTTSAFSDIYESEEFNDVTLVSEDNNLHGAHRVILAACSPFFQNLLRKITNPHPYIYLKGINGSDLSSALHFVYKGQVNVHQDDLDTFLSVAEDLKLKGLSRTNQKEKTHNILPPQKGLVEDLKIQETFISSNSNTSRGNSNTSRGNSMVNRENDHCNIDQNAVRTFDAINGVLDLDTIVNSDVYSSGPEIKLESGSSNEELDRAILSLMEWRESMWNCLQCGKMDKMKINMKNHIEGKHIEGVSHTCPKCGKLFRSRNSLSKHISMYHK